MAATPVTIQDRKIKSGGKTFDRWEVESALDSLVRAAEIRKNKPLYAAVRELAKERLTQAASIAGGTDGDTK